MKKFLKVQAVVPAAGVGERLESRIPKPFVLLKQVPLIVYALKILQKSPEIHSIVLAGHPKRIADLKNLCREYHLTKVCRVVAGGRTRRESVSKALSVIDEDTEYVLIHDAARPLVTERMISEGVQLCEKHQAVIAAVPVISTIKQIDPADQTVAATPDRAGLWEAQTPQIFKKSLIMSAHENIEDIQASDDAVLVERLGCKVTIFQGDYQNIKVTTRNDLKIAETYLDIIGKIDDAESGNRL